MTVENSEKIKIKLTDDENSEADDKLDCPPVETGTT